jgi:transcriptional regulator with XRE-family HTH domain
MSGARHHRPVGDQQVGLLFRTARIRSGKRQEDVAAAAGVHRSRLSSIERGLLDDASIRDLRAVATQLEIRVEIRASWRGGDGVRIVNERHSRMHELVAARLAATPGWEFATEVTFSEWGERGVIDILAWHAATRALLVIELKTEIPDPAGLIAQVDRYRRLAPTIGRDHGWNALAVATWVLVAESDMNRRQLARHRVILRNAFPLNGHFMRRWLRDPAAGDAERTRAPTAGHVSGLSFLVNAAGGDTNGRLGPTRRVRRRRSSPDRSETLANDPAVAHKRGNPAAARDPSRVQAPGGGAELG